VIYQQRNDILDAQDLTPRRSTPCARDCFTDLVRQYVPAESVEEQWDLPVWRRCWQRRMADRACPCSSMGRVQSESITDDEISRSMLASWPCQV
jgi:preprotein translocase subunit SecA